MSQNQHSARRKGVIWFGSRRKEAWKRKLMQNKARKKLRRQESNLRPPGYEPGELTAAPRRTMNIREAWTDEKRNFFFSSRS